MESLTVRISRQAYDMLRQLADRRGESMQAVLGKALEAYRRQVFLEDANADYEALQRDPKAWAKYQQELAAWDATLMDGLDPEENWTAGGKVTRARRRGKNSA
jgi:predicted transcriptional regulator